MHAIQFQKTKTTTHYILKQTLTSYNECSCPICLVVFRFLDEHLYTICMGLEQFSVNVPNVFSLREQLAFTNPPRRVFSKIGCRNLFAVSPVVWSRCNTDCHTRSWGAGRLLADAIEHKEMWTASSACFSDSCMFLMTTLHN